MVFRRWIGNPCISGFLSKSVEWLLQGLGVRSEQIQRWDQCGKTIYHLIPKIC